jgi:sialidase-1
LTPFFEKCELFTARSAGYHNYRIPGVVVTANGVVLAYCEARGGTGGDWDPIDILLRRSRDGGNSWEPPVCIASHRDYGAGPVNNVACIADRTPGVVHLVYCHNYARCFYRKSEDDGATFAEPVDITATFDAFRSEYDWNVLATGPGHGTQLRNERLVMPVWLSTGGRAHRPSVVSTVYSDDGGRSWERGEMVVRHGERFVNPSETALVELSDGSVMANIRSESPEHRRVVAVSPDGATRWSEPAFDDALFDPVCMGSLGRWSWEPNRILFVHPNTLEQTLPGRWSRAFDRKNVTVRLSEDDGRTWPYAKPVESGPSAYADLAAAADGTAFCFYECGYVGERMTDTASLTLARFNLAWLLSSE